MATAGPPAGAAFLASHAGIGDAVPNVRDSGLQFFIKYGDLEVTNGMKLPAEKAQEEPSFDIRPHHQLTNRVFTIVMFDPDAPSPANPVNAPFLHWIRANWSMDISAKGREVRGGDTLCTYMGPKPPMGTHRYIFALYEHGEMGAAGQGLGRPTHSPLTISDLKSRELNNLRSNFAVGEFAKRHGLGDPVASLYFTAEA